jgi:hypothetical protein
MTNDLGSMNVADLRKELVETYNLSPEQVSQIKGKKKLVSTVQYFQQRTANADPVDDWVESIDFGKDDNDSGDWEEIVDVNDDEEETLSAKQTPSISDPNWTEYVLKQLTDKELFDGRPTVAGLRRVTQKIIGPIKESTLEVYQSPSHNCDGCTVKAHIVIEPLDGEYNIYEGLGHADHTNNTAHPFDKFNVTIAETRAEGRALKKILGLSNIFTVEEIDQESKTSMSELSNEPINNNQINAIDKICSADRCNINVEAFVKDKHPGCKKLNQISDADAIGLLKTLSEYQQEMNNIPNDLKNYDPDWKEKFHG